MVAGGAKGGGGGSYERDPIAAATLYLTHYPHRSVQSFTMVRAVNISLIVSLCCLGSAVAQRQRTSADQRHVGAPSGFGSADYRRLHLTPYHGRGYHGINHVYQGHGTNRVNGYLR